MADEFEERFRLEGAERWIKTGFKHDDTQSWGAVLNATLEAAYGRKHKDALHDAVREYILETVATEDAQDDGEQ